MVANLRKQWKAMVISRKILWTLLTVVIYLLGCNIPLVESTNTLSEQEKILRLASSATGGDFNYINLFSLGIGPMMASLIIWQALTLIKRLNLDKKPKKKLDRMQLYIALVIAIVQAIVITFGINDNTSILDVEYWKISTIIILLGGTFFLIWLGNMNTVLGLGGQTIIILAGILRLSVRQGIDFIIEELNYNKFIILAVIVGILILVIVTVLMENAERRISINRIMINNSFFDKSYLSIKLNPAGGMAIMYALTLLVLPQYFLQLLLYIFPNNRIIIFLISNLSISSVIGLIMYILILFMLSIGFAFVNLNPEKISKSLRNSGDFIEGVRPGIDTREYLKKKILRVSFIGATIMSLLSGLPLVYGLFHPEKIDILMLPGTIIITVGLTLTIVEQLNVFRVKKQYKTLL